MYLDALKQFCHHTEVNLQASVRSQTELNGIKQSLFFREIGGLPWVQRFLHCICIKEMAYWWTENIIKNSTDSTNPDTILGKSPEKKNHAWAASMQREAWEMLYNVIMTNVSVNFNRHKELYKIQLIGDDRCLLHMLTAGEAS